MLFQSLAVLANHVVQTQVQLVKGESLLCVGGSFSRRVIVGFLRKESPPLVTTDQTLLYLINPEH